VSENRVLRSIFTPKRDEVTGRWRKLHNEELHNVLCSSSIIRMIRLRTMRWVWHVARMGAKRNAYMILVGSLERKKEPFGRPRHRWEDNIKLDLREVGVVWTGLIWLMIGTSGGLL
jgi:hypothetical protein